MCAFAPDELWAGACGNDDGLADVVLLQADGNSDFAEVHADKGSADVDTCVCLDVLERYGSLEACVASGCEGATCLWLWYDVHDFCIRDSLMLDNDSAVQVLTALGRDVDALSAKDAVKAFVNRLADFRDGVATDLVTQGFAGAAADNDDVAFF